MGVTSERVTSFIAYWLSVALATFGAMTPQDFAAWFGVLGVIMTAGINWYYRRKSYVLMAQQMQRQNRKEKRGNHVSPR